MYRVPHREEDKAIPIIDEHLTCWDLYAEFEDATYPKMRYVMGFRCRYTQCDISTCCCVICVELRRHTYNPLDEYHYVHVQGYDLRPPHVLNSKIEHATHAVRDWRKMYVEEVGMESQVRMDSKYVPTDPRWYLGQHLSNTEEFVGITQIFDANLKNFDPTLRQNDDRLVPIWC